MIRFTLLFPLPDLVLTSYGSYKKQSRHRIEEFSILLNAKIINFPGGFICTDIQRCLNIWEKNYSGCLFHYITAYLNNY